MFYLQDFNFLLIFLYNFVLTMVTEGDYIQAKAYYSVLSF